ncbi:hypothetical protein [Methylobacterium indicum]|uniref:hypothetical protein n=1 Tax=Methylobacterium indicum TaxID=1775910 RepID=UPI002435021B|nr:hypothetical protein [Methylobacterium indicum]
MSPGNTRLPKLSIGQTLQLLWAVRGSASRRKARAKDDDLETWLNITNSSIDNLIEEALSLDALADRVAPPPSRTDADPDIAAPPPGAEDISFTEVSPPTRSPGGTWGSRKDAPEHAPPFDLPEPRQVQEIYVVTCDRTGRRDLASDAIGKRFEVTYEREGVLNALLRVADVPDVILPAARDDLHDQVTAGLVSAEDTVDLFLLRDWVQRRWGHPEDVFDVEVVGADTKVAQFIRTLDPPF